MKSIKIFCEAGNVFCTEFRNKSMINLVFGMFFKKWKTDLFSKCSLGTDVIAINDMKLFSFLVAFGNDVFGKVFFLKLHIEQYHTEPCS